MSSDVHPLSGKGPRIVVLTAPSGAGKTSIARHLRRAFPRLHFSVSATTRPMREGERDGVDYHFLSADAFRSRIAGGELIEYEEVYEDRFYGTLRSAVDAATTASPVLLDIDVKGAEAVKGLFGPDALVLFVAPPSLDTLAARLRGRATDSDADIEARLARADMELEWADRFDVCIVNDVLERAADEASAAVRQFLRLPGTSDA